ncbi:MAG: helix-turn-helix domain-containing protein [Tetrasphaera sp.]
MTRQLAKGSRGLGDLRASAEYLGVDIDARRVLVHILDPLVSNDEPEPEADHRLVVHLSRRLGVEILHTRGSEGVLLLIEVDRALREHDVISRVRTAVSRTLVECCAPGAVAGVSRACEPADFAAAYREAREVARCVQRLGDGSGAFVLAVDDLGPARLFLANADTAALRTYVDGLLGPLLSGAPGMAELLLTTQVWLDCGRSIRATAARLGLHENTIRLRLARVEKFTGVDVSDTNGQLALQTGVLLLRLQGHPALARLDALDEGDPGRITA